MSGTGLDHPLVRDYLHELQTALAALPDEQAGELSEQISAHLDDALPPGAADQEVAAVLRQLGPPADLAAAAGAAPAPAAEPAGRRRHWLRRLGWRARISIAAAVILVAGASAYVIGAATAAPLQMGGVSSWWYARDSAREVDTTADGVDQTTVPIRSGRQQGFAITVTNPSHWTQTVLGPGPGAGSPGGADFQVSVATVNDDRGGGSFHSVRYSRPGSIPPNSTRMLRVLWTSAICLQGAGSSAGINQLVLRVRVGALTRTEVVHLDRGWYLSGPSQGPIPSQGGDCR